MEVYHYVTSDNGISNNIQSKNFQMGDVISLQLTISAHDLGNLLRKEIFDDVVSLADFLQYNFTVVCDVGNRNECSFDNLCAGSTCTENQVSSGVQTCKSAVMGKSLRSVVLNENPANGDWNKLT